MTKRLKSKLITWAIIWIILVLFITLNILVNNQEMQRSKPNIINIDGIAHLEKNGYVCKLLDSNGKQIVYNDQLEFEHKFETSHISNNDKDKDRYIFEDTTTGMIYILVSSDNNNIPMLNVMYSSSWVSEDNNNANEYNTITFITN